MRRVVPVAVVLASVSAFVGAFYANHWGAEPSPDTGSYLNASYPADLARTPVYPLFLDLLGENLAVASVAQGLLFVASALGVFALVRLITGREWLAAAVAVVVGTDTYLLGFAKPVIAEGLALPLVTALGLAIVGYLRAPSARRLWLLGVVLLLTAFTRVEWMWLAAPLLALVWAFGRPRVTLRAVAGVAGVLYALVALYVGANAWLNGYPGVTVVERINLLGKVMEYGLHDEAPARYAEVTSAIDSALERAERNPYSFQPGPLADDNWQLGGEYARAAIAAAPLEYAGKTIGQALGSPYRYAFSKVDPEGPFAVPLRISHAIHGQLRDLLLAVPAVVFLLALVRLRERCLAADAALVLGLACVLDVLVVVAGAYTDVIRLLVPIDPLRVVVLSVGVAIAAEAVRSAWRARSHPAPSGPTAGRRESRPSLPSARRRRPHARASVD